MEGCSRLSDRDMQKQGGECDCSFGMHRRARVSGME